MRGEATRADLILCSLLNQILKEPCSCLGCVVAAEIVVFIVPKVSCDQGIVGVKEPSGVLVPHAFYLIAKIMWSSVHTHHSSSRFAQVVEHKRER